MVKLTDINDETLDILFENNVIVDIDGHISNSYTKDDLIEALSNKKTKYVGLLYQDTSNKFISEYSLENDLDDKISEVLGDINSIDDAIKNMNRICSDSHLLNEMINLGIQLPQRIPVYEAYDDNINKKIKRYGQGLKNIYDWMIYQIL